MEIRKKVQLATSLPGAKPICLVGTKSQAGVENLAPFSSITHLGSNPLLIGMVTRPDTVERHTLQNILDSKAWTLNHITEEFLQAAHQCSAKYPGGVSEFEATGLTAHYEAGGFAPFVAESPVKFSLELEEVIDIKSNGTKLIVGSVQQIILPDVALEASGHLDLSGLGCLASTALDTYFSIQEIGRLPYARPE